MTFAAKYTLEQWGEARRLRADGLTYQAIADRLGFATATSISQRARKQGWSFTTPAASVLAGTPKPRGPSPATAQIRRALALRLYSLLELKIRMMELRMKKQLDASEQSPAGSEPDRKSVV